MGYTALRPKFYLTPIPTARSMMNFHPAVFRACYFRRAGGVPIKAAGNIVGAVGVSGTLTGAQDEKCANAGVQAVLFDLQSAAP